MISSELRIKDISMLKSMREAHNKKRSASATKSPAALKQWEGELACIDKFLAWLESGKDIRNGMDDWSTTDIEYLNEYALLTAKPVMFAINVSFTDWSTTDIEYLNEYALLTAK